MLISTEKKIREHCQEKVKDFKIKKISSDYSSYVVGSESTDEYDITYTFVNNSIVVISKQMNTVYEFERIPTLIYLKTINVLDFASKDKKFYSINSLIIWEELILDNIVEFMEDWCNVSYLNELNIEDKKLYDKLLFAVHNRNYSSYEFWKYGLLSAIGIVDWFTEQHASIIFNSGLGVTEQTMINWIGLELLMDFINS